MTLSESNNGRELVRLSNIKRRLKRIPLNDPVQNFNVTLDHEEVTPKHAE